MIIILAQVNHDATYLWAHANKAYHVTNEKKYNQWLTLHRLSLVPTRPQEEHHTNASVGAKATHTTDKNFDSSSSKKKSGMSSGILWWKKYVTKHLRGILELNSLILINITINSLYKMTNMQGKISY